MALCYSWLYLSRHWTPFFCILLFWLPDLEKKKYMASVRPWVSYKSKQEVSKALTGMCPLHLGDAFKLRLFPLGYLWAIPQLCLCPPLSLAAPLLNFVTILRLTLLSFCGYYVMSFFCTYASEGTVLSGLLALSDARSPPFTYQPTPATPFW